jgi:hypothetical protein
VTPKVIASLNESLGDSDEERDYTEWDGYEDLSAENQAKVREASQQGHVADSEWRGVRPKSLLTRHSIDIGLRT